MSFEITGRLVAKYDTVQRTETFKTREFVIEKFGMLIFVYLNIFI